MKTVKTAAALLFGASGLALLIAGCREPAATPGRSQGLVANQVAEEVATGQVGDALPAQSPAPQRIGNALNAQLQTPTIESILGPGSIDIVPASPTTVGNCIPFGTNTLFGFTGFIYRNVPAFSLGPGSKIAFDLGALNDVDVRRNIYFATANTNPAPAPAMFNVVPQGIFAASGWTRVVSDAQTPENPRGNTVSGDYELRYAVEAPFTFPGGGLLVGFGGSPPGAYADFGCEQVLVQTDGGDASGHFYARFFFKPDQTLGVLDVLTGGGGNGVALGGVVILPIIRVVIDIKPGSSENPINVKSKGVIPVAVLSTQVSHGEPVDFDATTIDPTTVRFGPGLASPRSGGHVEDVDGDGDLDMVFQFDTQASGIGCSDTEAKLTGKTTSGVQFEGTDAIRPIGC